MTTDVKLLPFDTYMARWDAESQQMARQYARANMEPLIAENERLRGEVAEYANTVQGYIDTIAEADGQAERLAEALRLALKWAEVLPTGEPLRAESVRDLDNARAALDQARAKGGGE